MSRSQRIFGIHAVQSAIEHSPGKLIQAWVDKQRQDKKISGLCSQLNQLDISVQPIERKHLEQLAKGQNHQGIMLELRLPQALNEDALKQALATHTQTPFYLVLDQVQDPHNLGACLRTADAAGVQGVILPQNQSVDFTPVVCKVASGAAETVPVYRVTNLARTLKWLQEQGLWIVGTSDDCEKTAYEVDMTIPIVICMGSEGKGLRRLTREHCDWLVRLPMCGYVSSLNLSVATGIMLYETVRQRQIKAV